MRFLLVLSFVLVATGTAMESRFFPERGDTAFHQRVNELQTDFRVLFLALQPGYEDLGSIAYFRLARGASVMTAYVTNGEGSDSDREDELPLDLAVRHRAEAAAAMEHLSAEAYFLNMNGIPAARDTAKVRALWQPDTLRSRLAELLLEFQPDLVLLARDWEFGDNSVRMHVLKEDLMHAVRMADTSLIKSWKVGRIASHVLDRKNSLTLNAVHKDLGLSYAALGDSAGNAYESLSVRRKEWKEEGAYQVEFPTGKHAGAVDVGMPRPLPDHLKSLDRQIRQFAAELKRAGLHVTGKKQNALLDRLTAVMDSVDRELIRTPAYRTRDRRAVVAWKSGLEAIRNLLLGVRVELELSHSILTDRQLTYLRVVSVEGADSVGTLELYFPHTAQGWILNEDVNARVPLIIGESYRLITPTTVEYDYPPRVFGIFQKRVVRPTYVFVLHRSGDRRRSFVYRKDLRISFSPKFTTEVLTPIVRASAGEFLTVRLTNHARDGVRDSVYVQDSLVTAPGFIFRLNEKGLSQTDTLRLQWNPQMADGGYVFDVLIADMPVGTFVARKYPVAVDSTRRVGVISSSSGGATRDALRRIGVDAIEVRPESIEAAALDVLILDRRLLSLRPQMVSMAGALRAFAERGGHLVVLAQDSNPWNTTGLLPELSLRHTSALDETTPLVTTQNHPLLQEPNKLVDLDFDSWIYRKGYNILSLKEGSGDAPVRVSGTESPLLVTKSTGSGRITYVDLALHPQWMNVRSGALKILANILAYR